MKKAIICFILVFTLFSSLFCPMSFAAGANSSDKQPQYECDGYTYTLVKAEGFLKKDSARIVLAPDEPSVTIPDELDGYSVTHIGASAFYNCKSLTEVTIPDSVTHIEGHAFVRCLSLAEINIPESVVFVGINPFSGCGCLKDIKLSPENEAFALIDGILYNKAEKSLICCPGGLEKREVNIPKGILSVNDQAFIECFYLTDVTIPDSVTRIGDYAFSDCYSLTEVTIPNSVTYIGDSAFEFCESLTKLTIPDSVTYIGERAFGDCDALTLIVEHDSYAAEWAKENGLDYEYPDTDNLDWLNN